MTEQGEDKPSPLLWTRWSPAWSIVGWATGRGQAIAPTMDEVVASVQHSRGDGLVLALWSPVYGILRTRQSSWKREKTMFMKRFTRPFRQLRGKLTLSYPLTSVVSFLLVELIFITVVLVVVSLNLPAIVLSGLKQEAPQAAPYFVHGSPDRAELTSWLSVANA